MKTAWISAGGNVGNVRSALRYALQTIHASCHSRVIHVSSLYQTEAWGNEDQDDFLNIAFAIETALEAEELLLFCLDLENQCHRKRTLKWGPRTLDLDILVYEGVENYKSESLTLPHPYLTERPFVLEPLCEIAPLLMVKGKTVAEWAQRQEKKGIIKLDSPQKWWQA